MDTKNSIKMAQDITRLAVLKELDLLDTPTEAAFDRLTRLASQITNSPVSLVSLVDANRQFFKSQVGLPEPFATLRETPLSHSFCMHVVADNTPLVVEDARLHPVLKDNLAIPDLQVIGYLGIPLTTTSGVGIGSFCIIDSQPRKWTSREVEIMHDLSLMVMTEIELQAQIKARIRAEEKLQQYADKLEAKVFERTAELRHVFEQLQEIETLKSKFIDDISHELRTPVTNISLYLELLARCLPENREKYEAILREQSNNLINLLNSVLDFSALQKSLEHANLEAVDLNRLAATEIESFRVVAETRGLELNFAPYDGTPLVWGDARQLKLAISHLLQNAVDYSPSGQIILSIDQARENSPIQLTIKDSGMGMDEDEVTHCFDRFYRGKRVGQLNLVAGAGLGLAKINDIVIFHKGWIKVESEINQGSTFSIYLPVVSPPG